MDAYMSTEEFPVEQETNVNEHKLIQLELCNEEELKALGVELNEPFREWKVRAMATVALWEKQGHHEHKKAVNYTEDRGDVSMYCKCEVKLHRIQHGEHKDDEELAKDVPNIDKHLCHEGDLVSEHLPKKVEGE